MDNEEYPNDLIIVWWLKRPSFYSRALSLFTGKFTHVESIPYLPESKSQFRFQVYEGHKATFEHLHENPYAGMEVVAVRVKVTREQYRRYKEWAEAAVGKAYNKNWFKFPIPKELLPQSEENDIPSKMFCSQAMLLALKHTFEDDRRISYVLSEYNHETTYPSDIYTIILKCINNGSLKDKVYYVDPQTIWTGNVQDLKTKPEAFNMYNFNRLYEEPEIPQFSLWTFLS